MSSANGWILPSESPTKYCVTKVSKVPKPQASATQAVICAFSRRQQCFKRSLGLVGRSALVGCGGSSFLASAGGPHSQNDSQVMRNWKRAVAVAVLSLFLRLFAQAAPHGKASFAGQPFLSQLPKIPSLGPQLRAPASTREYQDRSDVRRPKLTYARSRSMPIMPLNRHETPLTASLSPEVEYKKALRRTTAVVGAACLFGALVYFYRGRTSALEFFAGYLVEQSLSVDNLFVFIMLFDYFKVPVAYQSRVLSWGVIGAVLMRGVMISLGVAVIKKFRTVMLGFAGILLVSAYKLMQSDDSTEDLEQNLILRLSKMCFRSTSEYDGEKFFTTVRGIRVATPLFLCLVCIELSDFVFAVDSIPAVLGVSHDPLIVYSSNIFAIMGLRSLYTLVARAVSDLPYLRSSVAAVLAFVGLKMILEYFHYIIPTGISLAFVASSLAAGVLLSMWKNAADAAASGSNPNSYNVMGQLKDIKSMV